MGILPKKFRVSWEQLIWLGIALAINTVLLIIFITFRKMRAKRLRTNHNNINSGASKPMILNSARTKDHEFKRTSKMSNLEVVQVN